MSLLQESDSDVGSHHVAMVAALFYNVGLNNDEITGHNFFKQGGKFNKLKADIEATFTNNHGIQIALICEFGNMFTCVDTQIAKACSSGLMKQRDGRQQGVQYASTKELFEGILVELDLMYVTVIAQPAYVALIDTRFWRIITCERLSGICSTITRLQSQHEIFVQHLILQHKESDAFLRCFNGHMPSTFATDARKADSIAKIDSI